MMNNSYNEQGNTKKEKEAMGMEQFEAILDAAIEDTCRENTVKNTTINRQRYAILEQICDEIPLLFHTEKEAEIKMYSAFNCGSATLRFHEATLNRAELDRLNILLRNCSTISFSTVLSQEIRTSISVDNLYKNE